jgi:hypothetical protein
MHKQAELREVDTWQRGFSFIRWLEEQQKRPPLPEAPYRSRILPFKARREVNRLVTIIEWDEPE